MPTCCLDIDFDFEKEVRPHRSVVYFPRTCHYRHYVHVDARARPLRPSFAFLYLDGAFVHHPATGGVEESVEERHTSHFLSWFWWHLLAWCPSHSSIFCVCHRSNPLILPYYFVYRLIVYARVGTNSFRLSVSLVQQRLYHRTSVCIYYLCAHGLLHV